MSVDRKKGKEIKRNRKIRYLESWEEVKKLKS